MINSNAFNYINVLNTAADVSAIKNSLISNNLANNDTPGYKRKDIHFETYLSSAMTGFDSLDKKVQNLDLENLSGKVYSDFSNLSYRMDGNNVDVDTETASLAENQIRYYSLLDSMTQEFNRIKSVLQAN